MKTRIRLGLLAALLLALLLAPAPVPQGSASAEALDCYLKDNGGTANGGSDTSLPTYLQITATSVDDVQTGPAFTVNSTEWATDHSCTEANCTLREAIEAANNDGAASTIELTSGAVYEIQGVDNAESSVAPTEGPNGLPRIRTPITINAHGASITRNTDAPNTRLFYVDWSGSLTLKQIQLLRGRLDSSISTGDTQCAGGAILNWGTLIVKSSYLAYNDAYSGSAIHNRGTASIYNSTFHANSAHYGAIDGNGSLDLYSNTFLDNVGVTESAISLGWTSATKYNFFNNLLVSSGSSVPLCHLTVPSTIITVGGNLATDSSCTGFGVTTYSAIRALSPPDYHGGLTRNMAIGAGSSAIDVGNAAACQNANINMGDQRNRFRFVDGNWDGVAQCDVGSYEYSAMYTSPPLEPETDPPLLAILLDPPDPDGSSGWYRNPVTVEPQASDPSPVIELRCALDPAAPPAVFDDLPVELCPFLGGAQVSADGPHTFYAAAMDFWGNKSEVASSSFQIDATPPVITCPAAGPFVLESGDQMIGPAGVNASVSGLDEAASTFSGIVTTESVGLQTLTFTAVDLAGNSATLECSYNVIFDFGGYYAPVESAPAMNAAKAGQAVPLKFSLAGDRGLEVIAAGYPALQAADCATLEPTGPLEVTETPGQSGLSYDPETGWYNIVWKTSKEWAGSCRALVIQLVDGTEHRAYFQFQ